MADLKNTLKERNRKALKEAHKRARKMKRMAGDYGNYISYLRFCLKEVYAEIKKALNLEKPTFKRFFESISDRVLTVAQIETKIQHFRTNILKNPHVLGLAERCQKIIQELTFILSNFLNTQTNETSKNRETESL